MQAPATQVKAPAAVASDVLAVTGLDTTPHKTKPASTQQAPPPGGFRNGRPCSLYYGQLTAKYQADYHTPLPTFKGEYLPYAPCGYTGPQYRAAYEGSSNLDGSGITVAITDAYASPTIRNDITTYTKNHGDGAYAPGQYTQAPPTRALQPAGRLRPVRLVRRADARHRGRSRDGSAARTSASTRPRAATTTTSSPTLALVVDENRAQLVSNSWGDIEQNETADEVAAYENVFLQGALEGISFLYSSGDNGDELAAHRPQAGRLPDVRPVRDRRRRHVGRHRRRRPVPVPDRLGHATGGSTTAATATSRSASSTAPAAGTRRCSTSRTTRPASPPVRAAACRMSASTPTRTPAC